MTDKSAGLNKGNNMGLNRLIDFDMRGMRAIYIFMSAASLTAMMAAVPESNSSQI